MNNPDLPYPNGALPKTDDNPNFGPIADDFMFFSDEDGNDMIGFGELEDFGQAYFKYVGDESLAYYSVKANGGFTLYTYMTGLNSLAYVSTQAHNISHVTFWTGLPHVTPELGTWSMGLAAVAVGLLFSLAKSSRAYRSAG